MVIHNYVSDHTSCLWSIRSEKTHLSHWLHFVLLFKALMLMFILERPVFGSVAWVKCSMPSTWHCFLTAFWDISKYSTEWYTAHTLDTETHTHHMSDARYRVHRSGPDTECRRFIAHMWDSTSIEHMITRDRDCFISKEMWLVLNKFGLHETSTFTSSNCKIFSVCASHNNNVLTGTLGFDC